MRKETPDRMSSVFVSLLSPIMITIFLTACGAGSGDGEVGNTSPIQKFKTACHEVIAICNSNSSCTAFAEEMVNQNDLSQCDELKKQCPRSSRNCVP